MSSSAGSTFPPSKKSSISTGLKPVKPRSKSTALSSLISKASSSLSQSAQVTERFKFLVALRPGFTSPTLAAQMSATYQRISGGRLLLNIVT